MIAKVSIFIQMFASIHIIINFHHLIFGWFIFLRFAYIHTNQHSSYFYKVIILLWLQCDSTHRDDGSVPPLPTHFYVKVYVLEHIMGWIIFSKAFASLRQPLWGRKNENSLKVPMTTLSFILISWISNNNSSKSTSNRHEIFERKIGL